MLGIHKPENEAYAPVSYTSPMIPSIESAFSPGYANHLDAEIQSRKINLFNKTQKVGATKKQPISMNGSVGRHPQGNFHVSQLMPTNSLNTFSET